MAGIKPMFARAQIMNAFEQLKERADEKSLQTLQYLGEAFVNRARSLNTYLDRTGNLRASIGYIILKDGKIIDQNFIQGKEGSKKGKDLAVELAELYPSGFVLIGVAGMEYARYVEAKNYDVITGSTPESSELKAIWNEIKL